MEKINQEALLNLNLNQNSNSNKNNIISSSGKNNYYRESLPLLNNENKISLISGSGDDIELDEDINLIIPNRTQVGGVSSVFSVCFADGKNYEITIENNNANLIEAIVKAKVKVRQNSPLKLNSVKEVKIKIEQITTTNSKISVRLNPLPFIEKYSAEFSFEELKANKENTLINIFCNLNDYFNYLVESLKKGKFDFVFDGLKSSYFVIFETKLEHSSIILKSEFELGLECRKADLRNYYLAFKEKYFEIKEKEN